MSGGVAVKVPRETIHVVLNNYGMFTGAGFSLPKARLWVIAEPSSNFGSVRVAYNNSGGRVEWRDVGDVTAVTVSKMRWQFTFANGGGGTFVPAPCTCGGGQAAHAGPSARPHYTTQVRADQFPWITLT